MVLTVETGSNGHLIAVLIAPELVCHFKIIAGRAAAFNLFSECVADMQMIEFTILTGQFKEGFLCAHYIINSLCVSRLYYYSNNVKFSSKKTQKLPVF